MRLSSSFNQLGKYVQFFPSQEIILSSIFLYQFIFDEQVAFLVMPTFLVPSSKFPIPRDRDALQLTNHTIRLQRLVRFLAVNGNVYYGDALLPRGVTDIAQTKKARIITGDIFGKYDVTDHVADIRRLQAPLTLEHVKLLDAQGSIIPCTQKR